VNTALERRSKAELIALIRQMLRQQPELELLLETPLPTAGKRTMPVNSDTYRRQVTAAFRRGGYEWGAEHGIARDLNAVIAVGDGFRIQGDSASATAVYGAIVTEVLSHFEEYDDENGYLIDVIMTCAEGLGQCLTTDADSTTRAAIIDALTAIYDFDIDYGGIGMSDEVPDILVAQTTPEERRVIATKVRDALPGKRDWSRETLGGFLIDLEMDTLDDEAFLRICRETGRTGDLVECLLTLGRTDEAIEATTSAGDYAMMALADIFVRHNEGETAARLIAERAATTQDTRILAWLKRYYLERGDDTAALTLADQIFRTRSGYEEYREMREIAARLGRWNELRAGLLAHLRLRQDTDLLMRIHLDEGETDQAVALALQSTERKSSPPGYGFYSPGYGASMALEVAKAVEESHPRDALELYRRQAERLIDGRNRGYYRDACQYLVKVRDLYDALDEYDRWEQYLAGLRAQHVRLRALKEEMIAAELMA
jgi:hypothetical protein